MFVEIENMDLNPIQVETEIKNRRNACGKFTPELACWALTKTNNYANIKFVIRNIMRLPKSEWKEYKDFVLSCVDGREQSEQALKDLRELAKACGCEEEFNLASKNEKIYPKDVCKTTCVGSVKELKEAIANGVFVYEAIIKDEHNIDLTNTDLSKVYRLKCSTNSCCYLSNSSLPCEMDIISYSIDFSGSNFSKVKKVTCVGDRYRGLTIDLSEIVNLPAIDLSNARKVRMMKCDLRNFDEFKFMDGADVDLSYSYNFPKVVDVSNADVDLEWCDFAGVEKIIFGKDADLRGAKNLPKTLDFRGCDFVRLSEANLEGVEEIIFGSCGIVNMCEAKNLCKVVDVSNCERGVFAKTDFTGVEKFVAPKRVLSLARATNLPKILDLRNCNAVTGNDTDWSGVEEIKFKEGAEVHMQDSCNFPKKLDFSMCGTLDLTGCDFSGVKEVKFRDEAQMEYCMDRVKNFTGKFVYDKVKQMKKNVRSTVINVVSKLYEVE